MNERIEKFLEQCRIEIYGVNGELLATEFDAEKFAELLIEKFDLILANEYLDCVGENDKKSQSRIDRLRNRVKEYFGVKE